MREMWDNMIAQISKKDEEGQTLVEYALLLALIAIVCIVIIGLLGGEVNNVFSEITSGLTGAS